MIYDDDDDPDDYDYRSIVVQAVERLTLRPLRANGVAVPSCTLRAAVAQVFDVSAAEAGRLCKMFEFDPNRRVRKPL